jgi:hypothetical protein
VQPPVAGETKVSTLTPASSPASTKPMSWSLIMAMTRPKFGLPLVVLLDSF